MDYMIINRLNTSSLQECYVLDFGRSENTEERVNAVSVFGTNGRLRVSESAFDGYQREFRFVLRQLEEAMALIEAFKGQDNVIEFSYLRGSFFYCDLLNAYYVKKGMSFWEVVVSVEMHPFRYQKEVADVVLSSSGTITNTGSVYSEPVIVIEGNGAVTLTIGSQVMELVLDTKATIDCRHQKQTVYDKRGAIKNSIRRRGSFFELAVGRSGVATSGNVTKITIKGNWRYRV